MKYVNMFVFYAIKHMHLFSATISNLNTNIPRQNSQYVGKRKHEGHTRD